MTTHPQSRVRPHSGVNGVPAGSGRASGTERTLPTRPRRYGQWAATLAFLLVCLVAAGWLWQQKGDQADVLVVSAGVPAGQVIERRDLTSSAVSGVNGAIAAADVDQVVGQPAGVALVPGQVVTDRMITSEQVPARSERVVGVQLDATRTPVELSSGDAVSVLAVPPTGDPSTPTELGSPEVLAESATVFRVGRAEGGGTRISLIVGSADANRVAAFGAAGRLAVVQLPLGGQD